MRVIELLAQNFKGLRAVEITPNPHLVTISGKNGQGKTSVLDAIWAALAGGAASRQIPAPVRQGSDTAEVTVDLGDLKVTRTWTHGGATTALKVVAKDGAKIANPQTVLDKLAGALTFDPLAFSRLSDRDQVAALLKVVELPFDPAALAAERDALFAERTDANREAKRLDGTLVLKPEPRPDLPDAEVSIAELADQHTAAVAAHAKHAALERGADVMARNVDLAETAISDLTEQMERIKRKIATATDDLARDRAELAARRSAVAESAANLPDADALAARLRDADEINQQVRLRTEREALAAAAAVQHERADALTAQIEAIDERRRKAIAEAAMPLPGMSFDDRGVTIGGIPLKACSGAEQLRASVALAMAANPTLRIIRVTDGSLLDDDGLALIAELARDNDMQCWVERVDSSGEVGIVIEDGAVSAVND